MSKLHFDEQRGTWYEIIYTHKYGNYAARERNLRRKLRFTESVEERDKLFEKVIRVKDLRQKNAIRKEIPSPAEQHDITLLDHAPLELHGNEI